MSNVSDKNAARSGGRVARRRTRTRQAILDAAEQAFARDGYLGTSVDVIAETADVSIASIYTHFANKDALHIALADRAIALAADYMAHAYESSDSPLEQVVAAGDAYMRCLLDHPGLIRYLANDRAETHVPLGDAALHASVAAQINAMVDVFAERIKAAVDAGEATVRDPRLLARFLFGAWNGVVSLGLRTDALALTDAEIAACLHQAQRLLLDGIGHPAHRDAAGRTRVAVPSGNR